MRIKWLGHASFLVTSDKGVRILTDPYKSGAYNGAVGYGPIVEEADVVTVSHGHDDHGYVEAAQGSPQIVKGSGFFQVRDVEIKGIPTYHDASQGAERGKNVIFRFIVDGLRVCH